MQRPFQVTGFLPCQCKVFPRKHLLRAWLELLQEIQRLLVGESLLDAGQRARNDVCQDLPNNAQLIWVDGKFHILQTSTDRVLWNPGVKDCHVCSHGCWFEHRRSE